MAQLTNYLRSLSRVSVGSVVLPWLLVLVADLLLSDIATVERVQHGLEVLSSCHLLPSLFPLFFFSFFFPSFYMLLTVNKLLLPSANKETSCSQDSCCNQEIRVQLFPLLLLHS